MVFVSDHLCLNEKQRNIQKQRNTRDSKRMANYKRRGHEVSNKSFTYLFGYVPFDFVSNHDHRIANDRGEREESNDQPYDSLKWRIDK